MLNFEDQLPKLLIGLGILLIILGIVFYLGKGKLGWIGNLPGDIRIEKENFKIYFPVTTMILFSLLLTLIVNLLKRFF